MKNNFFIYNKLITALPSFFSLNSLKIVFNRISAIVLLFCAILTFNTLDLESIGSGIAIYGGLFHITVISQFMDIVLFTIASLILVSWPLIKYNKNINYIEKEDTEFTESTNSSSLESGEEKESQGIKSISYSTNYSLIILNACFHFFFFSWCVCIS